MTLIFSYDSHEIHPDRFGEFTLLLLAVTIGLSTLVAASHLLTLYLSLELVSITSYVLAGYRREHLLSNEAAFKYLLYGAFASGTLLYGLSLLYGTTGNLSFYSIHASLNSAYIDPFNLYAILFMIFVGFAFKMSAVPFHMWAPDVYQGSPTPVAAFFTVAPKIAGFAIFIRFFYLIFSNETVVPGQWEPLPYLNWASVLALLSAATMTLGNLSALFQKNAKRMLAYSSIAHAGYMMMGLVVLNQTGLSAILFYALVYVCMNLGAFFVVSVLSNHFQSEEISLFKGLGWHSPFLALCMTFFLFSLTGLPPLGGFIGKVYLFWALVSKELYWLLWVGILNTVISLYYYAYIVKEMFLERPSSKMSLQVPYVQQAILGMLAFALIVFGLYWEPFYIWIQSSLTFTIFQ